MLPEPYYDKDGITIFNADCRDILPYLPKVGAVFTDPPYAISVPGATVINRPGKGRRNLDFFEGDSDWSAMTNLVIDAFKLTLTHRPSTFVAWCGHRQIGPIVDLLESQGFSTRMLFWVKKCPPPATPQSGFVSSVEQAVYGYLPGRPWTGGQYDFNRFEADSYRHGQPGKVAHPTQKPLSLMLWQVEKLSSEETILDPFMGSGTTLVAAKQLGKKCIGIEIEEEYCKIAVERLAQEVLPL